MSIVSTWTIQCACALDDDRILLAAISDDALAEEEESTAVLYFEDGEWCNIDGADRPWLAAAVVREPSTDRRICVLAADGNSLLIGDSMVEAKIGGSASIVRSASVIGDRVVACGMGRLAAELVPGGRWRQMGPSDRPPSRGIHGFEAICGFSMDELYAVGWHGEMWMRAKNKWVRLDSPTSKKLAAVTCGEDGFVYAVGLDGTLLKGRNHHWEVLDSATSEDLWSVAWFQNKLYACSNYLVLELRDDGLGPVLYEDDYPKTCLFLLRSPNRLWSVGTKDIFSFDGNRWARLAADFL